MLTENEARKFATHWIQAWNSRDLDEIMSHYGPNLALVSPAAAKILNDPSGAVKGKEALQMYFQRGLETYPSLKFELVDVMWRLSSIVLYYVNQKGTKTGEFMGFDASGKVIGASQITVVEELPVAAKIRKAISSLLLFRRSFRRSSAIRERRNGNSL